MILFYPQYPDPSDPTPIKIVILSHWVAWVVSSKDKPSAITQIDRHVFSLRFRQDTGSASYKFLHRSCGKQICQPVFESFGHDLTQVVLCLVPTFADSAERL